MNKRSSWALPYAIFLLLFVALPLILIILYAFQDGSGNFTFGNFTKFFTDADGVDDSFDSFGSIVEKMVAVSVSGRHLVVPLSFYLSVL